MSEGKLQPIVQLGFCERSIEPQHHLRWFLWEPEAQQLVANNDPALASLSVDVRFAYLVLRAPGMLRLDIPMEVIEDDDEAFELLNLNGESVRAVTEGELAQAWLSTYFGRVVCLMKRHPDEPSLVV